MYCNENSGCENLLRGWIGKPNLKDHKNNNQGLRFKVWDGRERVDSDVQVMSLSDKEQSTALHDSEKS